jgi:hypothetical protein
MDRNVVVLVGRLGNQLFQYSFAQWLHQRTGLPSAYDLSFVHRAGLDGPAVLRESIWRARIRGSSFTPVPRGRLGPLARALRSLRGPTRMFVDLSAEGEVLSVRPRAGWYLGYWQRSEYALSSQNELRTMFGLPSVREPVIRVHVRRGDYVALAKNADAAWYHRGVARAMELYPDHPVEVVSDDPQWCAATLDLPVPFSVRTGGSVLSDFHALAGADALVATGSTFSWWAAFLGEPEVVHGPHVLPPSLWSVVDGVLVR